MKKLSQKIVRLLTKKKLKISFARILYWWFAFKFNDFY